MLRILINDLIVLDNKYTDKRIFYQITETLFAFQQCLFGLGALSNFLFELYIRGFKFGCALFYQLFELAAVPFELLLIPFAFSDISDYGLSNIVLFNQETHNVT